MAFLAKQDYCGLAVADKLVTASATQGESGSDVTALDEKGSVVANTYLKGGSSPSNEYDVIDNVTLNIQLGKVNDIDGKKFMLTGVSIGVKNSGEPTVSASATDVEADAETACKYEQEITVPLAHHAAFLLDEAVLGGAGCHLTDVSYDFTCNPSVARNENGDAISSDVHEGAINVNVSISQSGTTAPTLTPAQGWYITSPLTQTNPKSNYPTWSATLTKYLVKTTTTTPE